MDVVVDIECGSKTIAPSRRMAMVAKMDSLRDEVKKLTSEKRKRKRKRQDECLNFEKELEQEIQLLRGKPMGKRRMGQAAPSTSDRSSHCRAYTVTHDTSVRQDGTKPKCRVHKKKSTPQVVSEAPSNTCKLRQP